MKPEQVLREIAAEVEACTRCPLHVGRRRAVPGEGSPTAEIMLVGEAPGFYESVAGRPFVGPAGQLLDRLLEQIGLSRQQVFITNLVKCRPPRNRDPEPEEVAACEPYLDRQIRTIQPKIIVTLGRHSLHKFVPHAKIGQVHGQPIRHQGLLIVPMYHPAAALRAYSMHQALEEDFARLPQFLQQAETLSEPPPDQDIAEDDSDDDSPPAPQQLSLF